jgi:CRP-like cAMP-binding protein
MPQTATPAPIENKILAALPAKEYARLAPHLTPVELPLGETLYKTEDQMEYVYFPNSGVVSFVAHMQEGASVEVGLVGSEGMVGIPLVFGDDISPNEAIVQIADGGMRMKATALTDELNRGGDLQGLLMRFALALFRQVSQTAACNRNHHVGERLARWLLTCHDRVHGDELKLTQEFIAEMLGSRRSGVSEAAMMLQGAGLIRYSRGHITILDREGLEEFACECYATVKVEFDRLLGDGRVRNGSLSA